MKKTVIVAIDEHHNSMGTTHVYCVEGGDKIFQGIPVPEELNPERGKRYKVMFEEIGRVVGMYPVKNPFKKER